MPATGPSLWLGQAVALTTKNFILLARNWRSSLAELLGPLLFMLLLGAFDKANKFALPDVTPPALAELSSGGGPPTSCYVFDNQQGKHGEGLPIPNAWCVPLLYAPNTAQDVQDVMRIVAERNGYHGPVSFVDEQCSDDQGDEDLGDQSCRLAPTQSCGDDVNTCMLGFPTMAALRAWHLDHLGRSAAAVVFGDTMPGDETIGVWNEALQRYVTQEIVDSLPADNVKYEIWTNFTATISKWYAKARVDRLGAFTDDQDGDPSPFSTLSTSESVDAVKDSSYALLVQRMVDEALIAWRAGQNGMAEDDVEMVVELKSLPRLKDENAQSMSQNFATPFIVGSLMVSFVLTLVRIVYEKEMHVVSAMRCMGLYDSTYWTSYWVQAVAVALVSCLEVYVVGLGMDLPMFTRTDGGLLFFVLFTYMLCMSALAFLLAAMVQRMMVASVLGVLYVVVALFLSLLCSGPGNNPITYFWWEPWFPSGLTEFLSVTVLSPLSLCKILSDMTVKTIAVVSLNATSDKVEWSGGSDFTWEDMTTWRQNRTAQITFNANNPDHWANMTIFQPPETQQALDFLAIALVIYFALACYLNQVLPGPDARPAPPWYPFLLSYWMPSMRKDRSALERLKAELSGRTAPEGLDEDVAREINHVFSGEAAAECPVLVLDVRRSFRSWHLFDWRTIRNMACISKFEAVRGVSFAMKRNECFALLGHNGAGKTTLIKMMTAQLFPSKGDVSIFDVSVRADAAGVREYLGVCPQHDVLLAELSAREHLILYGQIKGLTRLELAKQVPKLVEHVKLTHVQDKRVSSYSGGMKRRVSVAVTFVGDPNFLLLDEPTTGMDPMNRRHIWEMIAALKTDRILMLTSHSMEEADALGDRIAIQGRGQFVTIGASLHLKAKFGEGYTIKLVSPQNCAGAIKGKVSELCPAMRLTDDNSGNMTFKLAEPDRDQSAALVNYIEEVQMGGHGGVSLTDWGISHTTLEDVFMRLAKGEEEGKAHNRISMKIRLPVGSYKPGQPFDFVGMDGQTYTAQPKDLPGDEQWTKMVEEWQARDKSEQEDAKVVGLEWQIKYEKRLVLASKLLANAIRVQLDKPTADANVGMLLKCPSANAPPEIEVLIPDGLAAKSGRVAVGDQLLAINATPAVGLLTPSFMLQSAVGNVVLSLKREQPQHKRVVKYQLRALLKRTILLQFRQRGACLFVFMMPIARYRSELISTTISDLGDDFAELQGAVDNGCSNITDIFQRACEAVVDENSMCAVSENDYKAQCGCVWNDPEDPYKMTRVLGILNKDNCEPFTADDPDSNTQRPRFHEKCALADDSGSGDSAEPVLPSYCSCDGPGWAFAPFRTDNWYCFIDARFKMFEIVDANPVKIIRNFSDRGFMPLAWSGVQSEYRDNWATFAGWRVSVIAPEGLNVGELSGHLAPNGWIGTTNHTDDEVVESLAARITATGLTQHFPRGVGVMHLDDHAEDDRVPVLDRVRNWRAWRQCTVPAAETCCVNVEHILRDCTGCTSNTDSADGCCACEDENEETWRTRRVCEPCNELNAKIDVGMKVFSEVTEFFRPTWQENPEAAWQCSSSGLRCQCKEERVVEHNIVAGSYQQTVHTSQALQRTCSESDGVWTNPRCATIKPDLEASCASLKAEVAQACESRTAWRHAAPMEHLAEVLNAHHSSETILGSAAVLNTAVYSSPLFTALQLSLAAHNLTANRTYISPDDCLPPTCYDFTTTTGSCAPSEALVARIYSELELLYPCHVTFADSNFSEGFDDPMTRGSVAEGRMCQEAHQLMNTLDVDSSSVPECSLSGASSSWTQCGSCTETVDCPEFVHFGAPLYEARERLSDVMNDVLDAQMAIRDETPQSLPTEPLVPFGESHGLEDLFPSVALEFTELDTDKAIGRLTIAGMWGDLQDWPYVSVPEDWPQDIDFTNVKFMCGQPACADGERLEAGGGIVHTMQSWFTNALLKSSVGPEFSVTTSLKSFPYELGFEGLEELRNTLTGVNVQMRLIIDLVVPLAISVAFPLITSTVVMEKEYRLRALMTMMGLQMRWYWLCEWLWNSVLQLLVSVFVFIAVRISEIQFAVRSPEVFFLLLVVWSQACVAFSFLSSVFHNKLILSYIVNFLLVCLLVLIMWIMNNSFLTNANDSIPTVVFLCAPIAVYRGIHLLTLRTYWLDTLDSEMAAVFAMLVVDTVVYMLAALYLDAVVPRQYGVVRHPLFCFEGIPWRRDRHAAASLRQDVEDDEDPDVMTERKTVEKMVQSLSSTRSAESERHPILVLALRKVYQNGKVAVRNVTFSIHDGECFGLLGPNGAGKTSVISILTGLYHPTAGSATICGFDIKTQMDKINERMGVCPQFDILWPLLSVKETLMFYLQIKGTPAQEWHEGAVNAAAAIDLSHALGRLVGRLSGGMKRRVSLAISLLGNPSVVFLDEPTTGLDPQTKRAVWSLIDAAKEGRSIVLTTHSMEEADALCGRIGIMARGKMRCIGSSLHLKSNYGEGYKVDIKCATGASEASAQFVQALIPGGVRTSETSEQFTVEIPTEGSLRLSQIIAGMEEGKDAGITAWALRQTSMEEVFLKVARKAEDDEDGRQKQSPILRRLGSRQKVVGTVHESSSTPVDNIYDANVV